MSEFEVTFSKSLKERSANSFGSIYHEEWQANFNNASGEPLVFIVDYIKSQNVRVVSYVNFMNSLVGNSGCSQKCFRQSCPIVSKKLLPFFNFDGHRKLFIKIEDIQQNVNTIASWLKKFDEEEGEIVVGDEVIKYPVFNHNGTRLVSYNEVKKYFNTKNGYSVISNWRKKFRIEGVKFWHCNVESPVFLNQWLCFREEDAKKAIVKMICNKIKKESNDRVLYIIDGGISGWLKFGKTDSLESRVNAYKTHLPFKPIVIKTVAVDNLAKAEKYVLNRIKPYLCKENKGSEWFRRDVLPIVEDLMDYAGANI